MAEHTVDIATFRLLYPAFADVTLYPDAYISAQFVSATTYMGAYDGCLLSGASMQTALNLLTAHLMAINVILAAGGAGAQVSVTVGATIDKVTVTAMPPPATKGWAWWLNTTPYGAQLWALLGMKSAGGWYIGGRPERSAFRKVGGRF